MGERMQIEVDGLIIEMKKGKHATDDYIFLLNNIPFTIRSILVLLREIRNNECRVKKSKGWIGSLIKKYNDLFFVQAIQKTLLSDEPIETILERFGGR